MISQYTSYVIICGSNNSGIVQVERALSTLLKTMFKMWIAYSELSIISSLYIEGLVILLCTVKKALYIYHNMLKSKQNP